MLVLQVNKVVVSRRWKLVPGVPWRFATSAAANRSPAFSHVGWGDFKATRN